MAAVGENQNPHSGEAPFPAKGHSAPSGDVLAQSSTGIPIQGESGNTEVPAGLCYHTCWIKSCGKVFDIKTVPLTDPSSGQRSHGPCPVHAEEAMREAEEFARRFDSAGATALLRGLGLEVEPGGVA